MDSSLCAHWFLRLCHENFQSKLNRDAKFQRLQIMHGDFVTAFHNPSRYEKLNLVALVRQTGAD